MGRKFGFSFSWKRALGLAGMKARLSHKIGLPLSRSGRERKLGRMLLRGLGCLLPLASLLLLFLSALGYVIILASQ